MNPNRLKAKVTQSELKTTILKAKQSFIFVGLFSFFINLLQLTSPLYMLQLYDRVMVSRSESTLWLLTGLVILLFATMALLEMVRSRVLVRVGNKIDNLLSDRIFESIFKLANKAPGKASSMPLSDLTQIRQFMTGNGLFAFFDTPWMPIYILVLFLFHPYFGFFAIFSGIILAVFAVMNENTTKEKLAEANKLNRDSSVFVDASLRNAEVIHAMGMQSNIKKIWQKKYFGFLNAQMIASDNAGFWSNISKSARVLFQSLILGLGGYLAIKAELSPGMMIAGSIIMGRALAPLDLMIGSWKGFSNARSAYERLNGLLGEFPREDKPMELPAPKGELLLESVVVVPPNAKQPSLKGISLQVNKGDIVGVIGPSAAGKSSLARAILGLWPLVSGKVRLDVADISQWDKENLGQYIGYLPQDIELFEGTISENICRFSEVDPNKVVSAAQMAGVHEMILRLPEGYDTLIGQGGATLSGGQRQRIGLARALYGDPVLVVLDEPNSNLDDVGEAALVESIKSLKAKGTTVILITHRPAILQVTNKLALMQQGLLQMYGNTNEVLQKLQQQANPQPASTPQQNPAQPKQVVSLSKPSGAQS
ncbi:MAG: type I secretion system permease/ATPase [Campylobacteraceae bacterium]|nr:type I secretion system permease/ATPase [Campylobacteraceae bacterium]